MRCEGITYKKPRVAGRESQNHIPALEVSRANVMVMHFRKRHNNRASVILEPLPTPVYPTALVNV